MDIFSKKNKITSRILIDKALKRLEDKYEEKQRDLFNEQIIQEPKAAFSQFIGQPGIGQNEGKG